MNESEFNSQIETTLDALEAQLEDIELDIDIELEQGILTLTLEDDSKIIFSRQSATLELWIAAVSGGYHLGFTDGNWYCQKTSETLADLLNRLLTEQTGQRIAFNWSFD